ncbi:hypothetical protein B0T21DRAFT_417097 [Apiosordaria backusii]|uniref:DUF7924 domain-containing protein n=1 Tax=Apiosordaria backusii TaxID=314023 RepID=A0AA39ZQ26_9PEZI|nr:hypothetical protein B0T21DRAFT_417097 [Apiosordaria backusii]
MDFPPSNPCEVAAHGECAKSKESLRRRPLARALEEEDQVERRASQAIELPTGILGQPIQGLAHTSRITRARPATGGTTLGLPQGQQHLQCTLTILPGLRDTAAQIFAIFEGTKPSSAYDDNFEQHMIDNGIYLEGYDYPAGRLTPEPENVDQLRSELLAARASLSPSRFHDSAFRNFKKKNKTSSEGTVMRNVIPIIAGNSEIPNGGHLPFTNLESMTGGATVKAVPDFFDGARLGDIDKVIRDDLSHVIIPTKHADVPVVPNFVLVAKAPRGGADVALRQALHDGAIGARAMHALQNYSAGKPAFDGKAHTISSTYHAGTGTLQLYAHHITAPTASGGQPEYHMTQIKAFALTSDRETFVQGATAFRNARDSAQRHRDSFIQAANAKARRTIPGSQAVNTEEYAASGNVDEEPALPQYLCAEDEEPSQESASLGAEPAMSFATSFTSSFSTPSQTNSKRTRAPHSPPSNSEPHKKLVSTRTRQSASQRAAGSSVQALTSTGSAVSPPALTEEY